MIAFPAGFASRENTVRGLLFSLALALPVLVGYGLDAFSMVSLCSLGGLFALFICPKHGTVPARVAAISVAALLVLCSAALSVYLQDRRELILPVLFILSWLAALPRPDQAYMGLVVKYMAAAALLSTFDFTPTPAFALAFFGGICLGTCLSLVAMAFEEKNSTGGLTPLEEFRALRHGAANDPLFGIAVPVTVLLSTLGARWFSFSDPGWVGLTALFIMHSDGGAELARIRDRALGTLLGVGLSAILLHWQPGPLFIAGAVAVAAFVMPFTVKTRYMVFSLAITCAVLLLLDIAMFRMGGDLPLLRWRLQDTALGCLGVLISNLTLRGVRRLRSVHPL